MRWKGCWPDHDNPDPQDLQQLGMRAQLLALDNLRWQKRDVGRFAAAEPSDAQLSLLAEWRTQQDRSGQGREPPSG